MHINPARLKAHIDTINAMSKDESGGYTRLAFSDKDRQAREMVKAMMEKAGLSVQQDFAGNILADLLNGHGKTDFIAVGSHIDTVQNGGPFDGLLGSMAAVEVLQTVAERNLSLKHPLRAIIFSDEEGARFGSGLIGSKAIAGSSLDAPLDFYTDKEGNALPDVLKSFDIDPARILEAKAKAGTYRVFLELHIEQSVVLEQNRKQIGIVTGIKGPHWIKGSFVGESNHAGGTPMNMRHDALVAAANFAVETERIASSIGEQFVATIGFFEVSPGGINTIPKEVNYSLDIRDLNMARRSMGAERILQAAEESAKKFGVDHRSRCIKCTPSVEMNPDVMQVIEGICKKENLTYMYLPSGAFHDALSMTDICKVGMIFVPSVKGISHSPKEDTRWEDVYAGVEVLYQTVVELATKD